MFCCWRGNLLAVKGKRSLRELKLHEQRKWILEKQCQLHSDFESCVAVRVVLNSRSGYHVPFILATCYTTSASQLRTKTYRLLMYDVDSGKDDVLPSYGYFDVPKPQTPSESDEFVLVHGPVVLWNEEYRPLLHVVHSVSDVGKMSHDIVDVQKYVGEYCTVKCIDKLWVFDWKDGACEEDCDMFMLFMRLIVDGNGERTESDGVFEWICLSLKAKYPCGGGFTVQSMPASSFVPCEYGYIANSLTLHDSFFADTNTGDIILKNRFIVGTTFNQVVLFEEGVLIYCISTPSIPQSVVVIQTVLESIMIAAQLQNGEVYAYKTNKSLLKANQSWQGVSKICAGDFAFLGHDQLLLYSDGGIEDSNFTVTDFCRFTTEAREEATNIHKSCPESLLSAVKALELRKHSGEAYLTSKEREVQRKSQLFQSSIHLLMSLGCGKDKSDTTKSDSSLVCVIPGISDVGRTDNSVEAPPLAPLKITSLWQRVINGYSIVGVVVKNISLDAIHSFWFSFVTSDVDHLESICRVIPIRHASQSSDTNSPLPPNKKPRLDKEPLTERKLLDILWPDENQFEDNSHHMLVPDGEVCIVMSTPLSASFAHEQEAMITACWKLAEDYSAPVYVKQLMPVQISLGQDKLIHSDKCVHLWDGEMELTMNDDNKAWQDLACVLGTRTLVEIAVHSTHANLLRLPAILIAQMPFLSHIPKTATNGSIQQDLFLSSGIVGDGLTLLVSTSSASTSLVIMYQSVAQLTLFVAMVRRCLPKDICLTLAREMHTREKALIQTLILIRSQIEQ